MKVFKVTIKKIQVKDYDSKLNQVFDTILKEVSQKENSLFYNKNIMTSANKQVKNEYIISFKNKNKIVDTILKDKITRFAILNRQTKEVKIDNYFIDWKIRYLPIKATTNLVKSKTLLFPSWILDYWYKDLLIAEIKSYIYRYIDIPDSFLEISAHYVLLTYLYEKFSEVWYLRLIWDYGSWKSRFLKVVTSICYNPIMVSWWTSVSAIFRTLDKVSWTLMLDEADFNFTGTQADIMKLLNNGYQKWNPVLRADWEKFDVSSYRVYWPKIIWWRYEFSDKATESRCLVNIMKKTDRKDIPTWLDQEFEIASENLRNKLLKFRYDYFDKVIVRTDSIEWIEPRLSQIVNPLLSVIDDKETKKTIINAIRKKQEDLTLYRKNTVFWWILEYIKFNFQLKDFINFWDIVNNLDTIEWRHNITPRKLWSILKKNWLISVRKIIDM